ncbi:MAG: chlorophyll synthesis pathway protein BchC [Geminicoccaceae bacterium]
MQTTAVVFKEPQALDLEQLELCDPGAMDVVVDIDWSGISTGTERLLFTGRMPPFPGMGYPLVPGYEAIGRVVDAGPEARHQVGETVFVPGARCFKAAHGLFGGSASRVVVPGNRLVPVEADLGGDAVLLALAATAYHAMAANGARRPDLIVGHGVLGRLLARLALLDDEPAPTVWETNPVRSTDADGYSVIHPDEDERRDYQAIYDVSGDSTLLNTLIGRLGFGGEITLAGFYAEPLSFAFPMAFMREARLRVAAEWQQDDMRAVKMLIELGRLSLNGLISHCLPASQADGAYRTAFDDPSCLKMILDWRGCA